MIKGIQKWYARNFGVISIAQAKEWNLSHRRNVFGDEINQLGCRSIWADLKGNIYRVSHFYPQPF